MILGKIFLYLKILLKSKTNLETRIFLTILTKIKKVGAYNLKFN